LAVYVANPYRARGGASGADSLPQKTQPNVQLNLSFSVLDSIFSSQSNIFPRYASLL
jgi:hypothetical protein